MSGRSAIRPSRPLLTPRSSAILSQKAGRAIEFILARGTLPVLYWLKRDVLGVPAERELKNLEKYAERVRLVETQAPDGGWRLKRGTSLAPVGAAGRFEVTVRSAFRLFDYGCDPEDDALRRAVSFLLAHQGRDGGFTEISGRVLPMGGQALTLTLLCRLGLDANARIQRGFRRMIKAQRPDGGWARPGRAASVPKGKDARRRAAASSPAVTGLVLGALAESPRWRHGREPLRAGQWILDWFFRSPGAPGRGEVFRWMEIAYPFWNVSLLSCLDALALMGFRPEDRKLRLSLEWLMRRQQPAGHWESRRDKATLEDHLWVTLSVLRILRRFGLILP
jgi:hypothetical protein